MSGVSSWFSRHAQAGIAALGRLLRRPLGTLLATSVIAIALALPAGLWVLTTNLRSLTGDVTQTLEVSVYLKPGVPLEHAERLAADARRRAEVASVTVISAEQGLAQFKDHSGFGAALEALDTNPLPHVLTIRPRVTATTPRSMNALRSHLAAWPEADAVQLDTEWVQRLDSILDFFQAAFAALAIALGAGVVAVIGNSVRLEIDSRRAEIEVTKLVGGSNAFVRRPFLYEGFFYGLIGGVLALAYGSAVLAALQEPLARVSALYGGRLGIEGLTLEEAGLLVGAGSLLGLLGAWLGAARHLARIEPRE